MPKTSFNLPTAIKILPKVAELSNDELTLLGSVLALDSLPPRIADLKAIKNEAEAVSDFLLKVDAILDALRPPTV